ncbi:MAG TPA: hypothetical protein VGM87_25125 [Roseomonas sp.]|jgi:hypothetical protein
MAQNPLVAIAERAGEAGARLACIAWINDEGQVEVATTEGMSAITAVGILSTAAIWMATPDPDAEA